jgi:hypothetical protein
MPHLATTQPTATANSTSVPVIETTASLLELLVTGFAIVMSLVFSVILLFQMSTAAWGEQLTTIVILLMAAVWAAFSVRTFHLYHDRFVIKRPMIFVAKADTTVKLSAVKEVIFKHVNGPYSGTFTCMIIKARSTNYGYRIPKNVEMITEFAAHLQQLGIKTSMINIT